jgi:hypothetical protein
MNEANEKREQEIAERARQLFAERVAGLDGRTRSRLAQARAQAVEAAGRRRFAWWTAPSRLIPIGAAAAAVLAVALFLQTPVVTLEPVESTVLNDLDILLEEEELDLFEELEFYAWLLEQPELMELDEAGDDNG